MNLRRVWGSEYLKIELMTKAPPWNLLCPEFSRQEQSMFHYRGWFVSPNTPTRGQLFINSVTWYAFDVADVMDNNNYATVLESSFIMLSLWVADITIKKVAGLDHWFLPTNGHLQQFNIPHSMVSPQYCIHPCQDSLRQRIINCTI